MTIRDIRIGSLKTPGADVGRKMTAAIVTGIIEVRPALGSPSSATRSVAAQLMAGASIDRRLLELSACPANSHHDEAHASAAS